jgi:hypothetical protein
MARRWRDITLAIISDQGGLENISEARQHLVRRLAAITSMLEETEAKYVRGEPIDTDAYLSMVNTATRLSNTIGLNLRTKRVPDLGEYINGKRPTIIDADEEDD